MHHHSKDLASSRELSWPYTAVVASAGLVLGAFLSRVLAEAPWVKWPFYRWGPSAALALIASAALTLIGRASARRLRADSDPAAHASSVAPFVPLYMLLLYLLQPVPNPLQAGVLLAGALALCLLLSIRQIYRQNEWSLSLLLFRLQGNRFPPGPSLRHHFGWETTGNRSGEAGRDWNVLMIRRQGVA